MNALKLSGALVAMMLMASLQADAGTHRHRSRCCCGSFRTYNYTAPQTAQSQGTAQNYQSFSFEPSEGSEGAAQPATFTPVYRPARSNRSVPNYLKSPVHRRLHPGT